MNIFKKISLFLFTITLALSGYVTYAADTGSDTEQVLVSASIENISLNKKTFKAGEDITGSFLIVNHSDFALSNISYRLSIGAQYEVLDAKTKIAGNYLDTTLPQGDFFIERGQGVVVPFAYRIPNYVGGKDVALSIEVLGRDGGTIAFADSNFISIEKKPVGLKIEDAYVVLDNGEKFALGDGPMIFKDKKPSNAFIEYKLTNTDKKPITIKPHITLISQSDTLLQTEGTSDDIIIKPDTQITSRIQISKNDLKPGVYLAYVSLLREDGETLGMRIESRFVIAGDIATLHLLTLDKNLFTKGDLVTLTGSISGSPFDISLLRGSYSEQSEAYFAKTRVGSVDILLLNETNQQIFSIKKDFDLNSTLDIRETFESQVSVHAAHAVVEVKNEAGKIILSKSIEFGSGSLESQNINQGEKRMFNDGVLPWVILAVGIIIIIIIFMFLKRFIKSKWGLMLSIILLVLTGVYLYFGGFKQVIAGCNSASIKISAVLPYKNQVLTANEIFFVTGNVAYTACENNPTDVDMVVTGPRGNQIKRSNIFTQKKVGGHGWFLVPADKNHFSIGPFSAPSAPGDYKIKVYAISHPGICTANTSVTIPVKVVENQINGNGGGGGGCGNGNFYCDVSKQCVPDGTQCNITGTPTTLNPNIPAILGPVKLKKLAIDPPVGNAGYSCRIEWNNAFSSYDSETECTFSGDNGSVTFNPIDTNAPLNFDSGSLYKDSVYKMTCKQKDTGVTDTTEAVCRLNVNYKEVN